MISASIAWIIMGSPIFIIKKLNLNTNIFSESIYKCLFYCGCVELVLGIFQKIFDSVYWYIPIFSVLAFLCFYSIKKTNDYLTAQKVMDELTRKDERNE